MIQHDALKAIGEEINGLLQVKNVIKVRTQEAQDQMTRAESALNAFLQIGGFLESEIDRKKAVRDELVRRQQEMNK